MPADYVWVVSAGGIPYRIPAIADPVCQNETEWKRIPCSDGSLSKIVSSSASAFAIDHTGRVLILVLPTHISIRECVEIYENQRWIGIWRGTLPFDRSRYSDESGKISKDLYYGIKSGWSWEDKWFPNLDPRKYDKDGWQYSLSYLFARWHKQCGMHHIVRRRLLRRHVRYTSHDQWIEIPNEESLLFTELAISGADVMSDGEILLFALGTNGSIYRREGIHYNCPSGDRWKLVPKIKFEDSDDIILITASPSLATLLAITWDGKMFQREGITKQNPIGLTWKNIDTPQGKAVIYASIGNKTMWCITADRCVWFTMLEIDKKLKEHNMRSVTKNGYHMVTQGGISTISVTKNDQVFCVSTQGKIQVRTGIEPGEPSGRRFENIVDGGETNDQKWISLHSGSVSLSNVPEYLISSSILQSKMEVMQFKKAEWRFQILERLKESSDSSWAIMNGFDLKSSDASESDSSCNSIKRVRCQIMQEESFRSINVTITDTYLDLSGDRYCSKKIETSLIRSVLPSFQKLPQKYLLLVFIGPQSDSECFSFTDEKSRNTFQEHIEDIIRSHICSSTRNSFGQSMWSVSTEGVVRWHCLAEMKNDYESCVNIGESRGLVIDGIFKDIDCGYKRSVWAINENGSLYALSSQYDPLNSQNSAEEFKMINFRTFKILEYQKFAVFRGFISFQGSQKGISAWMCDGEPCSSAFSSLPSANWNWVDSSWELEDEQWMYSSEIDGAYEFNKKDNGKARRRSWIRKAKFELKKSPWCLVESPPIENIRISKVDSPDGTVVVLALTEDGHILKRNGVNRNNFTGTSWTEILTDSPISRLHLQWEGMKLWCITHDGLILFRSLKTFESNNFWPSSGWTHLDMDLSALNINLYEVCAKDLDLTGYSDIIFLRISNAIFRIDLKNETVSDSYPIVNLQQVVVNAQGYLCFRGNNITVVRDWKVVHYSNAKTSIIFMRKAECATNMGRGIKNFAFY